MCANKLFNQVLCLSKEILDQNRRTAQPEDRIWKYHRFVKTDIEVLRYIFRAHEQGVLAIPSVCENLSNNIESYLACGAAHPAQTEGSNVIAHFEFINYHSR